MMMSGKQFSLDSRIDLAEAVEEASNDQEPPSMELPLEEKGGEGGAGRGRSLSVVENSEVAGQVGVVLRRARGGQVIAEDHEEDDEDDCAFFTTILQPNQTASLVKMIKQVCLNIIETLNLHTSSYSLMTTCRIPTMSRRRSRKLLWSSTSCWMTTRSSTSHPMIISMLGMKPIKTLKHKKYNEDEIKIMTMFLREGSSEGR